MRPRGFLILCVIFWDDMKKILLWFFVVMCINFSGKAEASSSEQHDRYNFPEHDTYNFPEYDDLWLLEYSINQMRSAASGPCRFPGDLPKCLEEIIEMRDKIEKAIAIKCRVCDAFGKLPANKKIEILEWDDISLWLWFKQVDSKQNSINAISPEGSFSSEEASHKMRMFILGQCGFAKMISKK